MMDEVCNIIGLSVYTPNGIYVGNVDNVVMDLGGLRIDGLFIKRPSPVLVEGSAAVNIPYRWVKAVGDIVLLKAFPEKVTVGQ